MKKLILSLVAIATISLSSFGQAPEGFKYQAVVRDASNTILNNQAVGMRMTIQQGSIGGTPVYQETFAPTTNGYGLVNLEIGSGTVISGDFTTIDWANGTYFIETAVDATGGTSYSVMGTSQLMSVPYALHAKTAENVTNDMVDDADADPTNELQNWSNLPGIPANIDIDSTDDFSGDYNDLTNQPTIPTVPTNVSAFTNDAGYLTSFTEVDGSVTNELQVLSISNDTVFLSDGGFAILPAGFDGQYGSLSGAPTTVSSFTNDAGYLTSFTEIDGSITNELQALSISNDTIFLSDGGFAILPSGFDGQYGSLTGAPTTLSQFTNNMGFINNPNDADNNPTNEIQNLTFNQGNNTLSITGGNIVQLKAPCAFSARRNGNLAVLAGETNMYYLDEAYDLGNNFDGTYFTASTNGVYAFDANMYESVTAGNYYAVQVYKNNAFYKSLDWGVKTGGAACTLTGSFSIYLLAGETIMLKNYAGVAGTVYGSFANYNTSFSGYRVQ